MNIDNIIRSKSFRKFINTEDFEHIYNDMVNINNSIDSVNNSIVSGSIPFVNNAGNDKPLPLTANKKVPFQKSNGTDANLNLILAL